MASLRAIATTAFCMLRRFAMLIPPGLECTPAAARASQQHKRGLVEGGSRHSVAAFRDAPDPGCLAGLVEPRREPVMRSDALGSAEPSRVINTGAVGERHHRTDPGSRHQ